MNTKLMPLRSLLLALIAIFVFSALPHKGFCDTSKMIVITDMGFIPTTLTLEQGQPAQLIIHNKDEQMHSFVIPQLNISTPYLTKGQMYILRLTPEKAGNFHFHANTSKFGDSGFTGSLVITKKETD